MMMLTLLAAASTSTKSMHECRPCLQIISTCGSTNHIYYNEASSDANRKTRDVLSGTREKNPVL